MNADPARGLPMHPSFLPLVSRIGASLLGGYLFVWGFTVAAIMLASLAGMSYEDARTLAYLLAFLVYLAVFLWAFAERHLLRVWLRLAGGGSLLSALAWCLAR